MVLAYYVHLLALWGHYIGLWSTVKRAYTAIMYVVPSFRWLGGEVAVCKVQGSIMLQGSGSCEQP